MTRLFKTLIVLAIPFFVMLGSARLLTTETYLAFEYGKASFPPDTFGFTQQQRLELASVNMRYVRDNLPDDTLANETLDGKPVYSEREVTHMMDVQTAFQTVWRALWIATNVILLSGFVLWRRGDLSALASAIQSGGLLTAALIGSIALLALLAWQVWFDNFHLIFFEPGSWLFAYSDTLIRLFPLQFWMDATFTISAFGFIGGSLLAFLGWRGRAALLIQTR
jgi:integral membrane protein (TIGR01906 family)